jgi:uncharacterized membrane protein
MKARLSHLWDSLRSSLWFVPTLMTVAGVALSFATIALDQAVHYEWLSTFGWI